MKKSTLIVVCAVALLALTTSARAENAAVGELTQRLASEIDANSEASPEVKTFAKETLLPLRTNPVFDTSYTAAVALMIIVLLTIVVTLALRRVQLAR